MCEKAPCNRVRLAGRTEAEEATAAAVTTRAPKLWPARCRRSFGRSRGSAEQPGEALARDARAGLHLVVGRVVEEPVRRGRDPGRELGRTGGPAVVGAATGFPAARAATVLAAWRHLQQDRHLESSEQLLRVLVEELVGGVRLGRGVAVERSAQAVDEQFPGPAPASSSPRADFASSSSAAHSGGRVSFSRSSLSPAGPRRARRRWPRRHPG